MREYKFRALDKNKNWVYGFLTIGMDSFFIEERHDISPTMLDPCGDTVVTRDEIDPKTIGEYTGLKDKNGKEIFEGDIVSVEDFEYCMITFPSSESQVEQKRGAYGFTVKTVFNSVFIPFCTSHFDIEIIGNIHENPELLK
jgi:uncharacterized phage protein (TIGR01671 family)